MFIEIGTASVRAELIESVRVLQLDADSFRVEVRLTTGATYSHHETSGTGAAIQMQRIMNAAEAAQVSRLRAARASAQGGPDA